jgi:hypothetical protein
MQYRCHIQVKITDFFLKQSLNELWAVMPIICYAAVEQPVLNRHSYCCAKNKNGTATSVPLGAIADVRVKHEWCD